MDVPCPTNVQDSKNVLLNLLINHKAWKPTMSNFGPAVILDVLNTVSKPTQKINPPGFLHVFLYQFKTVCMPTCVCVCMSRFLFPYRKPTFCLQRRCILSWTCADQFSTRLQPRNAGVACSPVSGGYDLLGVALSHHSGQLRAGTILYYNWVIRDGFKGLITPILKLGVPLSKPL